MLQQLQLIYNKARQAAITKEISEIVGVESPDTFIRTIYAGNAIATVQSSDTKKVLTIRPTAFQLSTIGDNACEVSKINPENIPKVSEYVGEELTKSDRPELTSAKVIISGGRGMQNGENFELLDKVAAKLNAAVGASRAAVDAGFVPNDYQVGQTGKVVAPESLYCMWNFWCNPTFSWNERFKDNCCNK